MREAATQSSGSPRRWPITSDARTRLIDEIARLRRDLAAVANQGLEEGIVSLPVAIGARRLGTLSQVLEACEVVDDRPCAAIGRRATLRDPDGEPMSFEIVVPGDGDPTMGAVSADSPLGGAILGARPGDVVEVAAPAGRWSVAVLSIE
jgi:transcription elongation GreA/GreB family factor